MNMKSIYIMLLFSVVLIALLDPQPDPELVEEQSIYVPAIVLSLTPPRTATGTQNRLSKPAPTLRLDFYDGKCDSVLATVSSSMSRIVSSNENATAQLLRLMFHDCFIHGCDGSILLGNFSGNDGLKTEKHTKPSETLKGFDIVDELKEELESQCPGVVSCSDILVLATRDAVILSGGPFFPVVMGRRDSKESFVDMAISEMPRPNENISETIRLFSLRHFSIRDTVALLGAHNIGKMDCKFIRPRFHNFEGTIKQDPTLSPEFLAELIAQCPQDSNSSMLSGTVFGPNYYQRLLQGRGLIAADQQLMANNDTADLVREYATDPTGRAFLRDFAGAMTKMSQLEVIGGSQGEVRRVCSLKNNEKSTRGTGKSAAAMNFNINMLKAVVFILCLWVGRIFLVSA